MLLKFRTSQELDVVKIMFTGENLPAEMSLEEQFFLISSLPNFHKWNWGKSHSKCEVKFEQRFSTSCRYYPGSPRNRVLQV
jgi:hypothetical protein